MIKKILCLIIATSMLLSSVVFASSTRSEDVLTYEELDDTGNIQINIDLPDEYEGKLISLYVFNPQKTWSDFETAENGKEVLQHAFAGAYTDGLSTSFKINPDLYPQDIEPHFIAVLTADDIQEEIEFTFYSPEAKQDIIDEINSGNADTSTLAGRIINVFGILDFELYDEVADKQKIAEKIIDIYEAEEIEATEENLVEKTKEAILLVAIEESVVVIIFSETEDNVITYEIKNNDIIGCDDEFNDECSNISPDGIALINSEFAGKSFGTIEALRTKIEQSILVNAVYNNKKLGYGHIKGIIDRHSGYLVDEGLDLSVYDDSNKDEVGRELIAKGKKEFDSMISYINKLAADSEYDSSDNKSSNTGGSSLGFINTTTPGMLQGDSQDGENVTSEDIFSDISDAPWAKEYIENMYYFGIVSGSGDGKFNPNDGVTRAQYITMVVKAFRLDGSGAEFADVNESDWFYDSIQKGVGSKIIYGDGENFYPNSQITRQDIAVIILRALQAKGIELQDKGTELTFEDKDSISDYAYEAVKLLNQYGVINGDDNNCVKPLDYATRAEACVILIGIIELANGSESLNSATEYETPSSTESATTKYKANEAEVLVRIGAISTNMTASTSRTVTRGEFAEMMARYMKKTGEASISQQVFDDVDESHPYAKYISLMDTYGVMGAKVGNKFAPSDALTWEEAVTAVTYAMGYFDTSFANAVSHATSIGLLKGISKGYDETVIVGDVIKLFYNSLGLPTRKTIVEGDSVKVKDDGTFLESYYDLTLIKGIMNGNAATSFNTENTASEGEILIDSVAYNIPKDMNYINDYLGYYLYVYYDEDIEQIVHFEPVKNEEKIISDHGGISFDGSRIKYYDEDGKKKTFAVSDEDVIIYNGSKLDSYTTDMFDITSGSIEIISPRGARYKVIRVYKYITDISNGGVENINTIYLKAGGSVNLDDYLMVAIRDENDVSMDISEIQSGYILSIAESNDEKAISISVGTTRVTDTVNIVNGSDRTITAGDVEYECVDSLDMDNIKIGTTATLYLDFKGRVAYVANGANNLWRYAYLIDAKCVDDGIRIKYLADDGVIYTVNQEETEIVVDGYKLYDQEVIDALKYNMDIALQDEVQPQMIKYRINSNGKIVRIDTARRTQEEDDSTLSLNRDAYPKRTFRKGTSRFYEHKNMQSHHGESNMYIGDTTIIFNIPDKDIKHAKNTDFSVTSRVAFTRDRTFTSVYAFDTDFENGDLVGALLIVGGNKQETTYAQVKMFFVKNKNAMLNADDEIVEALYGYDYTSKTWMTLEDGTDEGLFANVGKGDVIRYVLDEKSKVYYIYHDFDNSVHTVGWGVSPLVEANASAWSGSPQYSHAMGVITHKNGKWINFSKDISFDKNDDIKRGKYTYDISNADVFVYEESINAFEKIELNAIQGYIYDKNPNARVYIYTNYGELKLIIIYV